jgi:hypothetical protein
MAWITVGYDNTLVQDMGDGQMVPIPGAPEAIQNLMAQGHRITVVTDRFAPMPDSERMRLKEQLEQELEQIGFPPMEIWTGFTLPASDAYIDSNAITFDNDWNLAIAQLGVMLEERGLMPGPQPDDGSMEGLEGGGEEPPPGT